jgi:hypothetical protein
MTTQSWLTLEPLNQKVCYGMVRWYHGMNDNRFFDNTDFDNSERFRFSSLYVGILYGGQEIVREGRGRELYQA